MTAVGGNHNGQNRCVDTGECTAGENPCTCTPRCVPDDSSPAVRCCADVEGPACTPAVSPPTVTVVNHIGDFIAGEPVTISFTDAANCGADATPDTCPVKGIVSKSGRGSILEHTQSASRWNTTTSGGRAGEHRHPVMETGCRGGQLHKEPGHALG